MLQEAARALHIRDIWPLVNADEQSELDLSALKSRLSEMVSDNIAVREMPDFYSLPKFASEEQELS